MRHRLPGYQRIGYRSNKLLVEILKSQITERKPRNHMNIISLYRPYLSLPEIELIISTIDPTTELYKKLAELQIKIKYNLVKPAATITRKESVSESLGFSQIPTSSQTSYDSLATKSMEGTITEQEKAQGKELELKLFSFNSGIFD